MAEIKVNLTKLEGAITRLNNLAVNWRSNPITPPATIGGGKTVNELEELVRIYSELNDHMATLASNTAAFFDNIKDSYQESDHKASVNINKN